MIKNLKFLLERARNAAKRTYAFSEKKSSGKVEFCSFGYFEKSGRKRKKDGKTSPELQFKGLNTTKTWLSITLEGLS